MKKCVVVFKSRTQVMSFIDFLSKKGIYARGVPTPKEARVGCGISAEIPYSYLTDAKRAVRIGNFSSFYGIFLIEKRGNRTTTTKI
ncbi:MAG: DUF3343 domain-containing protein [Clostridia bacterium]|nr:DUF3343 domain-containing protein [Clostridia bacterium]